LLVNFPKRLLRLSVLLLGLTAVLSTTTFSLLAQPRPKRVLIISTGSRLAPGFIAADQQLLQVLENIPSTPVEVYAENLDIVRFPAERAHRIFNEYLSVKYANQPPDLVILVFVGNLEIPGKLLPQLFPGIPIVVAGLTEEELRRDQFGPLISGVAERVDSLATLQLILRLQPETRRIVVIGGTAEIDRNVLDRVKESARSITGRVEFEFWDNLTMAQVRQGISTLPPQTAILFARMYRDAAGHSFISAQVGQTVARLANVPVYIMSDVSFGTGAVGGVITSVEAFGKRAGEMARRILTGTNPTSLPFEVRTDTVPTFDWRALKRWNISEDRLPPNSVVRFRQQSLWQEYFWYILAAVVIIILQAVIIVDLLVERRRRIRIQAELAESRDMIELAANAGELGLWARDLKSGGLWANTTLRSMFGLGKDEIISMNDVLKYVHSDDRQRVMAQVERAERGNLPFEEEFRVLLSDGSVRWILAKGRGVRTPERRMGVILDITERKRAEEALRESEERFRMLADTAPVMIWMAADDKLCTFFNKSWLVFTGRTLERELGNGWTEGVHPEDLEGCVKTYSEAFDARQRFMMDYRLRRFDGDYRWVLDTGAPRFSAEGTFIGYIGSAIDITERKRSAEELEEERAFLRQVIDIVPNFIFAKDREGRFTLANRAIADAYGTSVDDLIGKTDADFNSNRAEVEFFRRIDQEVIDRLQERFIPEERVTDACGNVRWLQSVKRPIIDTDGIARQVLGASTDITLRKDSETQLREQRAELAHVARISTMGELAASLAHELNQPLTAILSNAQAALRFMNSKPIDLEEVREILHDIVKDNSRAGEVIRRMRALVKKEELEFASIDLEDLIRDVATLLHSDAILQDVQILLALDDGLPAVLGDRVQLQQVALNILLNAFDAMKDCQMCDRKISVTAKLDDGGQTIKVAVRDGGIGLTTEKLDKVFQPFYTTKRDGMGMGLSICRSIIEAHGGQLWAENNSNARGATFYFTVPVEKSAEPRVTASHNR
jgi:PAS domain S-box-containing protein